MSRRLSAIKFAHQPRNLPDPTWHAGVVAVWRASAARAAATGHEPLCVAESSVWA